MTTAKGSIEVGCLCVCHAFCGVWGAEKQILRHKELKGNKLFLLFVISVFFVVNFSAAQ
jgi:hypothetical protein